MSDITRRRLKKVSGAVLIDLLDELDQRLYPGIFERVTQTYLSHLEKTYPGFIDPNVRGEILNTLGLELYKPRAEDEIGFVLYDIRTTVGPKPEGYMFPLYGWACIMMQGYRIATWHLIKAQMCRSIPTDNFTELYEIAHGGDRQAAAQLNVALTEALDTFHAIVLEQYDRFYKNK